MSSFAGSQVTIRPSRSEDSAAIRRLAALDSAPVPRGDLLLAAVDGRLLAALSLADGRAIADPFAETVSLVDLLAVRAAGRLGVAPAARRARAERLLRPRRRPPAVSRW